jgi:hypothetical protein
MDSPRIPITPKQSLINAVLVSRSLPVVLLLPGHVLECEQHRPPCWVRCDQIVWQPGLKRRERETIDEIKTGKQQKLDLLCMLKICLCHFQPMDLVVNAIVKSAMRRHRIQLMMNYFKPTVEIAIRSKELSHGNHFQFLILLHP